MGAREHWTQRQTDDPTKKTTNFTKRNNKQTELLQHNLPENLKTEKAVHELKYEKPVMTSMNNSKPPQLGQPPKHMVKHTINDAKKKTLKHHETNHEPPTLQTVETASSTDQEAQFNVQPTTALSKTTKVNFKNN